MKKKCNTRHMSNVLQSYEVKATLHNFSQRTHHKHFSHRDGFNRKTNYLEKLCSQWRAGRVGKFPSGPHHCWAAGIKYELITNSEFGVCSSISFKWAQEELEFCIRWEIWMSFLYCTFLSRLYGYLMKHLMINNSQSWFNLWLNREERFWRRLRFPKHVEVYFILTSLPSLLEFIKPLDPCHPDR